MKLFIIFIIANIANVLIQTVKSILTVKGNKWVASIANAVAYGLYTWIVVLMVCELDLWVKMLVIALCNLVGVFVVKLIEEKSAKDKLWKVEATIPSYLKDRVIVDLKNEGLPFNYIDNIGNYTLFNIYCNTQQDSFKAKKILDYHKAKYFVSESKSL